MADSRTNLATLILIVVVLTLLAACVGTTIVLWLLGDWEKHEWGLWLSLRIMWGLWVSVLVATILTHITMFGWRFRRPRPSQWPAALVRAVAQGAEPPSWFKSGATSFTITVVLVSLFSAAFLASLLLWIIGDWREAYFAFWLRIIWGTFWVLLIATVLTRIAIFGQQRKQHQRRKGDQPPPEGGGDDGRDGEGPPGGPPLEHPAKEASES